MELSLALTMPRDEQTVPVARHIVRNAMQQVGVEETCVFDTGLALSEACTNVLLHSGPGDQYVVRLDLLDGLAVIRVIDVGHGFDAAKLRAGDSVLEAERGRGLGLMQALVDRVDVRVAAEQGGCDHADESQDDGDGHAEQHAAWRGREGLGHGALSPPARRSSGTKPVRSPGPPARPAGKPAPGRRAGPAACRGPPGTAPGRPGSAWRAAFACRA